MTKQTKVWTPEEAKLDALQLHPDCKYAEWENGLDMFLRFTIVVNLWRNEECWAAGDPPKYVEEGYYRANTTIIPRMHSESK
jgi:hypothetical protein